MLDPTQVSSNRPVHNRDLRPNSTHLVVLMTRALLQIVSKASNTPLLHTLFANSAIPCWKLKKLDVERVHQAQRRRYETVIEQCIGVGVLGRGDTCAKVPTNGSHRRTLLSLVKPV